MLRAAVCKRGWPDVDGGGERDGPPNGGFDGSGLGVYAVYQATHRVLYHQAAYQWQHSASEGAVRVSQAALRPGDIVFFPGFGTASAPGHVGIYYGMLNGTPTVVDAYDSATLVGMQTFSQAGVTFIVHIRVGRVRRHPLCGPPPSQARLGVPPFPVGRRAKLQGPDSRQSQN